MQTAANRTGLTGADLQERATSSGQHWPRAGHRSRARTRPASAGNSRTPPTGQEAILSDNHIRQRESAHILLPRNYVMHYCMTMCYDK